MTSNTNVNTQSSGMSFKKKAIIALCSLVGVVAIVVTSVLATVAYLTSSAAVSNVFTIGNVGIKMTETKVDENGVKDVNGTQVDTNVYKLVPNKTYSKDPKIFVDANSEQSYLFVLVRNDIENIEDKEGATIASQLTANGWAKYIHASTGWVYVYVGAGNVPVTDATKPTTATTADFAATPEMVTEGTYNLFESFTIDENANVSAYGAAKVTITAVAIQSTGFADIHAAWAAVIETYPYIHTGQTPNT